MEIILILYLLYVLVDAVSDETREGTSLLLLLIQCPYSIVKLAHIVPYSIIGPEQVASDYLHFLDFAVATEPSCFLYWANLLAN